VIIGALTASYPSAACAPASVLRPRSKKRQRWSPGFDQRGDDDFGCHRQEESDRRAEEDQRHGE
jgi:hypothetical protein